MSDEFIQKQALACKALLYPSGDLEAITFTFEGDDGASSALMCEKLRSLGFKARRRANKAFVYAKAPQ